jgi:CRP-like cAMP-binding protein
MGTGLEELGIVDDEAGTGQSAATRPTPTEDAPTQVGPGTASVPAASDASPPPSLAQVLETCPLFAGLLPVHLARMAKLARVLEFKKNQHIFEHGDEGDGLFIILSGAVRISRNVSGIGEEALAVLRDGQHFGEMSLIDDDVARSADAICHEDTRVVKLPKHDLRDLMFVDRELAYELLWRFVRTLAGRLRDSNDRLMMLSVSSKF